MLWLAAPWPVAAAAALSGRTVLAGPAMAVFVATCVGGLVRRERARGAAVARAEHLAARLSSLAEELRAGADPRVASEFVVGPASPGDAPTRAGAASFDDESLSDQAAPSDGAGLSDDTASFDASLSWTDAAAVDASVAHELRADCALSGATGASLALLVSVTAADLRKRVRLARDLEVELAGVRATAVLLCALPCVGLLLAGSLGLSAGSLMSGSVAGPAVAVGLALAGVGLIWVEHLMRRVRRAS